MYRYSVVFYNTSLKDNNDVSLILVYKDGDTKLMIISPTGVIYKLFKGNLKIIYN